VLLLGDTVPGGARISLVIDCWFNVVVREKRVAVLNVVEAFDDRFGWK
jgi:hypothetical protein